MIRRIRLASIVLALGLVSGSAHAALQGRDLNGSPGSFEAYYDTDRNITWLADANYAKTSGYDADGKMDWAAANYWVANLSFTDGVNVYDNWRLPATSQPDASCSDQSGGASFGYGCTGSEMGHLYYTELGNKGAYDAAGAFQPGYWLTNKGPFTNFQSSSYWSGTEYAPTDYAWFFNTTDGHQGAFSKNYNIYAWAVRPGDVAAVPIPAAAWLLGSGLLGLIGVARRQRGLAR